MRTEIQTERLTKMRDYLAIPRVNFHLSRLIVSNEETVEDLIKALTEQKPGTTACGAGFIPLIFPEDYKYVINWDGFGYDYINQQKYITTVDYFGISRMEWNDLFLDENYPEEYWSDSTKVADKITQILNG